MDAYENFKNQIVPKHVGQDIQPIYIGERSLSLSGYHEKERKRGGIKKEKSG